MDEQNTQGTMALNFDVPARTENGVASAYRLVRRGTELVLQGCFVWQQGANGGFTWRDIPTVNEAEADQ